jgi:hypothetical protein
MGENKALPSPIESEADTSVDRIVLRLDPPAQRPARGCPGHSNDLPARRI